jgi:hypothetical protein
MKKKYNDKVRLLMTDTDSLVMEIETDDVYADMQQDKQYYDFSGYNKKHPHFSNENKKVIGKFKDECDGNIIEEYIGLRAKMYSIKTKNKMKPKPSDKVLTKEERHEKRTGPNCIKKAKGVKKLYVKRSISHEAYYNCLYGVDMKDKRQSTTFCTINSSEHRIYTQKITKIGLCNYDDKVHLLDSVQTLPHGHYSIVKPVHNYQQY